MLIQRTAENIIPPSEITPRELVDARRQFMKQMTLGAILLLVPLAITSSNKMIKRLGYRVVTARSDYFLSAHK